MKAILTTFISSLVLGITLFAQSAKYTEAMQKQLEALEAVSNKDAYQEIANNFERIGNAEKTEWLPYYYAGYAYVMQNYMEQDLAKVDAICDKADDMLSKAASLAAGNSEITTVQAMVLFAKIRVDNSRGMTMGPKGSALIQAAMAQQPSGNPRTMMNMAQNLYYTPEAFGGSKSKALELMEKALAAYDSFKPETSLHPNWGKEYVKSTLEQWKASK